MQLNSLCQEVSHGGSWDLANRPEWSLEPHGACPVWTCAQWPLGVCVGLARSWRAPPVTGIKVPGGFPRFPVGLAAKVLVVS